MKNVIAQVMFEITDFEKQSEKFQELKNKILSGELQRDFTKNIVDKKYFKPEIHFIPYKLKSTLISNRINQSLYQMIWMIKFKIDNNGEKSSEFIELKDMILSGKLAKDFSSEFKQDSPNYINVGFIPKNITITITIK